MVDRESTGSHSRSQQCPAPRPAGHELQGHHNPPVIRQPMNPPAVGRRAPVDEHPADLCPVMQGSRMAIANILRLQIVISRPAAATVRSAVVMRPTTMLSQTTMPQSMTVSQSVVISHSTTTVSQPTAPQSTTVSPASDTQSTPRLQTATVSDAQPTPCPQTATVTSIVASHPVT